MPSADLVSIVVPAFNQQNYLRETIESLLAQTYSNVEVIVIDDGSTDSTPDVLRAFGSSIRSERISNRGATGARNHGASIARGEWIAFCDHDDLYLPQKIEKQMALAAAAQVDYVTCDFVDFSAAGVSSRSHFSFAPENYWGPVENFGPLGFVSRDCLLGRMVNFQPNITSSPLMRRSFFDSIGGWDETLRDHTAEDTDFHFRSFARQQIGVVPEVLWHYRRHPQQGSSDSLNQLIATADMWLRFLQVYPEAKVHEREIQAGIEDLRLEIVLDAFHRRRLQVAQDQARRLKTVPLGLRCKLAAARFPRVFETISKLRRRLLH